MAWTSAASIAHCLRPLINRPPVVRLTWPVSPRRIAIFTLASRLTYSLICGLPGRKLTNILLIYVRYKQLTIDLFLVINGTLFSPLGSAPPLPILTIVTF